LFFLPTALSRWIALLTTSATFGISLAAFGCHDFDLTHFTTIVCVPWVPALGMNYHLAVDGISLTVARVHDSEITIGLIPETLQRTTLGRRAVGDKVNLEVDIIAKYVERLLEARR
jgi:hypothetical protein